MSDKEIIKALERCKNFIIHDCKNCFYHKEYNAKCVVMLVRDALDLINRQQTEIERLQKAIKVQDIMIEQQDYKIKSAKSEAIKEFAERLKATSHPCGDTYIVYGDRIDNLVKEMTESPTKIEHSSLCETDTYEVKE